MKPSEIYRAAADVLLERGWTRGLYVTQGDEYCAVGAIAKAEGATYCQLRNDDLTPLARKEDEEGGMWANIVVFNDRGARDVNDVVMALLFLAEEAADAEFTADVVQTFRDLAAADESVPA